MTENTDQMTFPVSTIRIEKPRRTVIGNIARAKKFIQSSGVNSKTADTLTTQTVGLPEDQILPTKTYRYGEGPPDELGRTNINPDYGIPAELSTEAELKELRDSLEKTTERIQIHTKSKPKKNQGLPDELGRTNKLDPEYGIPAAFYSEEEIENIKNGK
ncbi:hypothetical protein M1349_03165 [Patescibacteria group bacterium]|nr:hypothetical protein [Patescibacteria group bacterium]